MRKVVAKIVDDEEFFEVHEHFAKNIICGFSRLDGHPVGIVGNQPAFKAGVLDIESSEKAARFVPYLRRLQHPDHYLHRRARLHARHRPGVERDHPPRSQAALRHTEATVPKLTVVTCRPTAAPMTSWFQARYWPTSTSPADRGNRGDGRGRGGQHHLSARHQNSPTPDERRATLIAD